MQPAGSMSNLKAFLITIIKREKKTEERRMNKSRVTDCNRLNMLKNFWLLHYVKLQFHLHCLNQSYLSVDLNGKLDS